MDGAPKRGRGRGRGGRGRGRARGRGRGRGKKAVKVIESDEEVENTVPPQEPVEEPQPEPEVVQETGPPPIDLEADISQLEAPTFTTINRGPPEPMLRLNWDHKVHLIGEKVLNPMIHCCDKCLKPILIYGRMIPCKHVFCLSCGKKENKQCPRCLEKVSRVEQTGLGTVFMCTHGGSRYGSTGCRRTYLSQRDLQAHINHRHVSSVLAQQQVISIPQSMEVIVGEAERASMRQKPNLVNDPRSNSVQSTGRRPTQIQSSGVRTNLITVPIQETAPVHDSIPSSQSYYTQYSQAGNLQPTNYSQTLPPMHIPPPQQPQYYATPPAYSPAAQTYPAYTGTNAAVTQAPYVTAPVAAPPRVSQQYDYNAATTQWTNNQQYYR